MTPYINQILYSMQGCRGYIYSIGRDPVNPTIMIRWDDPNSPDTIVRYLECKHLL